MNILEPMKTVCATCGKLISGDSAARKISHGICDTCDKRIRIQEALLEAAKLAEATLIKTNATKEEKIKAVEALGKAIAQAERNA